MSEEYKVSIEQRAHDLALLTVQLDVQGKINSAVEDQNIDILYSYIDAYKKAFDGLKKVIEPDHQEKQ